MSLWSNICTWMLLKCPYFRLCTGVCPQRRIFIFLSNDRSTHLAKPGNSVVMIHWTTHPMSRSVFFTWWSFPPKKRRRSIFYSIFDMPGANQVKFYAEILWIHSPEIWNNLPLNNFLMLILKGPLRTPTDNVACTYKKQFEKSLWAILLQWRK